MLDGSAETPPRVRAPNARVVDVLEPRGAPVPVVLDSPHSGSCYPRDFRHAVSMGRLRRLEDAFVDELFAPATVHGATLVRANFPRAYIDVNRRSDDIDAALLDGPWPQPLSPSSKVAMGIGLIAKRDLVGALYDRRLGVTEVQARIEHYYWPYHRALQQALDSAYAQAGGVWHVNCHSMKSSAGRARHGHGRDKRPDFCVGDRDGSTCSAGFTECVVDTLRTQGYAVSVNDPYKGVELVRRYADPAINRHSLQIEINRGLYMDEMKVEKHAGFERLAQDMSALVAVVAQYACGVLDCREAAE